MEAEKGVLVTLGRRNRIVRFSTTPSSPSDKAALTAAVKAAFSDVLSEEQEFFLQMKSEDWGGAFVELLQDQIVPDKAVIEAIPVKKSTATEVCCILHAIENIVAGIFIFNNMKNAVSLRWISLYRLQLLLFR